MGELQQLRAALFDLTEQIRGLRADLERPQTQLAGELDRLHALFDVVENMPRVIEMKLSDETKDVLEAHSSAVAEMIG
tara:strand:+ start:12 stop:245 length:234 start_codon:yes stop_codon:yes gene_type:complete